ncbi:MAG: hypothetical protein J7647_31505 [Cyanobacteria bacterium SBLK]|nr:hypothetical protein [Cyanobacteria bacterium SBLK]
MTLIEILPAVQQLSKVEKLKLIRMLTDELNAENALAPLETGKTYHLPTPYNCFGAGSILIDVMQKQVK